LYRVGADIQNGAARRWPGCGRLNTSLHAHESRALTLETVPGKDRRARDAGVISKLAGDDLDALDGAGHGVVMRGLDDDGHHLILECFDQSATKDDVLGIDEVDDVADRNPGVLGGVLDHLFNQLVPLPEGLAEITAAEVMDIV